MPKTYYDQIIVALLKERPGECYITPDGEKLYALSSTDKVIEFTGPDFNKMSSDEINQFIVDSLKQN